MFPKDVESQNKNEFINGRLYVPLPERFYTPSGLDGIVSLQHYPISTHQGDFDGFGFGFYSGKEGDSGRQQVLVLITQFIEELKYAESLNIHNYGVAELAKLTLGYFKSPTIDTIEDVLTGETIYQHGLLQSQTIPLILPNGVRWWEKLIQPKKGERLLPGNYQARAIRSKSNNLGIFTACSRKSETSHSVLDGLFDASGLYRDKPDSILYGLGKDIRTAKLSATFR